MNKNDVFALLLLTVLLLSFLGVFYYLPRASSSRSGAVIHVPQDYSTIQEALNHAAGGDTVLISKGVYHEHLSDTVGGYYGPGVKLIGEDPSSTIIDGGGSGTVIYMDPYTHEIFISNLTIRNGDNGIYTGFYTAAVFLNNSIVANCGTGINFVRVGNSLIYHNNFINNTQNVFIGYPGSTESWDNGYPDGGNYWSDYKGSDFYSGPYQNITGSDGIGDTPYVIDANDLDYYPLMTPYTPPITYDVTIAAHCNTESSDVNVSVWKDGQPTIYHTPYTFTGLTGMHTFTVSNYDASNHPLHHWNTGALTNAICTGNAGTFTAFYLSDNKPVAVLTVQDDVVNIGTNVYFFGDTSYTPDGSKITSYFFDFGDGENSGWVNYSTVGATHAYSIPGQYRAKLVVINNEGVESDWSTPHEITVLRTPSYPIAALQVTPQEAGVGTSIMFNASLSTDPDGWISEYGFDFGDGSAVYWTTNPIVYHTYTQQRTYYSQVTVSDNSGLETVSGSIQITVPKYYTDWKSYDHNYWYTEPKGASDPPCDSDTNLVFTLPAHNATFQQKVATKNTLSYGRFIVRFKMSKYVTGLLGSFFLYCAPHGDGAPDHQEIDVEWWGKESSDLVHFVFWQNGGKGNGIPTEDKLVLLPFSLDDGNYHTCEIDCEPNKVAFIIDGTTYYEKTIAITPPLYFFTGQVWAREWAPPADYKLYVDSTEIWQDSAAPTSTLSISAKSPVNLFLTDPLNRSIGTDPNTGLFVNEIPDAFYTGPYADPQNILVPEPLAGKYVLLGSGTGNGNYILTIESVANNSFIDAHSWQGVINAGQVIGENITLDPGGGVALTHDIRTENLTPSKTIAGHGYCIDSNFTVEDCGNCTETFNVTVYVNQTVIAQFINVTLTSRNWTSLLCEWNTTGFGMGDYTVAVVADPVPGELDIGNNNCTCTTPIHIGVPGDVSGTTPGVYDGVDNMKDIAYLVSLFNTRPSSANWNPNADVNGDGVCNMRDIAIAVIYFNQHE